MKFSTAVILLIFSISMYGQNHNILLKNSKKIDPSRYSDFSNTPYVYDHWLPSKVEDKDVNYVENITCNFNAETQELEVRYQDEYIELDPLLYPSVEMYDISKSKIDTIHYHPVNSPWGKLIYAITYYDSDSLLIYGYAKSRKVESARIVYTSRVSTNNFKTKNMLVVKKDGETTQEELKKDNVLDLLANNKKERKELKNFMSKQKLDVKKPSDLKRLVDYHIELQKL
ncbi:MAG TPA: hypothetical protein PK147_06285 [Saprospiraceae bacterium]|nr:hypothetical protein [Saprospiraceae bacterium]MCB9327327.1 hypothetical protein [Lewinellaceae bacterium]HPK10055.1 hypothetical protein [Saprospiraceae bacterium]HPQ21439.1 hypothetical protein [Saprospiraceae bacterium]